MGEHSKLALGIEKGIDMDFGYSPSQFGQYGQQAYMPQQRPQFQPQQFPPAPPSLAGKVVMAPGDIMPGDIPMNGTPCWFPMQDGSAVYAKMWRPDGSISTIKFVPEAMTPSEPTQMDRIEGKLSELFELLSQKEVRDE